MDGLLSKAAIAVGGIATIGAAVFFGLYKQWLTLGIFAQLTADQTFILMILFLVLVFLIAIGFLIAHALKGSFINHAKASNNSVATINNKK
jgi:type VI protein secretion system component VasK